MEYPKIYPSREQVDFVHRLLNNKHATEPWRGDYDGDGERRFNGFLAQTIIADYVHHARPELGTRDTGDIRLWGKVWDVKAQVYPGAPHPNLPLRVFVVAEQVGAADFYLFLCRNKLAPALTYHILGYATREDVLGWEQVKKGETYLLGNKPYVSDTDKYVGHSTKLKPVRELTELHFIGHATTAEPDVLEH